MLPPANEVSRAVLCNVDWAEENGMMELPGPQKSLMVSIAVWIQRDVQTDGRTDGHR